MWELMPLYHVGTRELSEVIRAWRPHVNRSHTVDTDIVCPEKKNKDVSVKPEVKKAEGSVPLAAAQVCSYTFPASECHSLTTPVKQESCNGNSASRGCLWPEKEEKESLVSNLSRLAELRKGHLPSWEVTGLLACHQCHLFDQAHPT